MTLRHLGLVALVAGLAMAASGASAFTIVTQSGANSGSANFTDPDQKAGSGSGTMQFGNTTVQMRASGRSYGWSPALQDRFVPNPAARLVPSLNR